MLGEQFGECWVREI
jgi:hypothetical protein